MFDYFARLIATAAGFVALTLGLQLAPTIPSPRMPNARAHDARSALDSLDIAEGLQATLVAQAPTLTNPTNLDVDARGRVWVCEGFNYREQAATAPPRGRPHPHPRRHRRRRQGRQVDGLLPGPRHRLRHGHLRPRQQGHRLRPPNVFVFTDNDGDDKADKKEVLFTRHRAAAARPRDPRLHLRPRRQALLQLRQRPARRDPRTRTASRVVDLAGNVVERQAASRIARAWSSAATWTAATSRCSATTSATTTRSPSTPSAPSGSRDNDDDGNRGVRINYVMEYGNYGYNDEMTGAGWQRSAARTSRDEIPLQHWHLNDPGVVPNLLQTGAGSPTGICVYEGKLLPEAFRDQMIHCDAGPERRPRLSRAPRDGAGYKADDRQHPRRARSDNWFRPPTSASRRTARCSSPTGTTPASAATTCGPDAGPHLPRRAAEHALHGARARPVHRRRRRAALNSPNLATRYLAWRSSTRWAAARRTCSPRCTGHRRARACAAHSGCSRASPAGRAIPRRRVARHRPEHPHRRPPRDAPHRRTT